MRASVAFLALCFVVAAAVPKNPQRIWGGSLTTIDQYPTIASLLYSSDLSTFRQVCCGSIINTRTILTSAYCTLDDTANKWRIRLGSSFGNSGGIVHYTGSIISHPNFDFFSFDNDVSLLRTASAIVYVNNAIQPAFIAGSNYNIGDNQVVWAAGWGTTEDGPSEQLRHVQIWTINQDVCKTRHELFQLPVTDNMLCTGWLDIGGRSQCNVGGPLYHNNVVVGVSSWSRTCDSPYFPFVNARVSSYTTWIQANA